MPQKSPPSDDQLALRAVARAQRGSTGKSTFWRLMTQVTWIAGLIHLGFIGLFWLVQAWFMVWVNVGSVLLFATSWVLLRRHVNLPAIVLIVAEILAHAALAVRALGWDSGFHYYLVLVLPIATVSPIRLRGVKAALLLGCGALYLALDALMRMVDPLHALPPGVLSALRYANMVATLATLCYLASLYVRMMRATERQLLTLATTDPLTRLYNRRRIGEIIDYEVARARRVPHPLTFILCDIDHFKSVNDQHGHACGDQVLVAASEALRGCLREQDSVARWGGEEFLIVLPNTDVEGALLVAERARAALQAMPAPPSAPQLVLTMTFGVAAHRMGDRVEATVARADAALYRGKADGRNRVVREEAAAAA